MASADCGTILLVMARGHCHTVAGEYELSGAKGQPDVGIRRVTGECRLRGGLWRSGPPRYDAYLALVPKGYWRAVADMWIGEGCMIDEYHRRKQMGDPWPEARPEVTHERRYHSDGQE
jgi:hypothetical protein